MYSFSADANYLLVGCLGGLGRSLTSWMVERGAKHLAFMSRSGADNSEAAEVIRAVEQAGASAKTYRADVSNEAEVRDVVNALMTERPIRGVVHAAMVLRVRPPFFEYTSVAKLTFPLGWHVRKYVRCRLPSSYPAQGQGSPNP